MSIVYVGGTFDCFHEGHSELLDVAIRVAGVDGTVIVAVNSDSFVQRHKGIVLQDNQTVRVTNVKRFTNGSVATVTCVLLNDDEQQLSYLDTFCPDFVLHGEDWSGKALCERYHMTYEWLNSRGITLLFTPRTTGQSSTRLRELRGAQ
jgi:cytidyltransferase-like protein